MMILEARSKNAFGFRRLGLKTGVKNDILWSEIGSGFEELGGTPPPRNPRSAPPPGTESTMLEDKEHTGRRQTKEITVFLKWIN